jgi:hypothetical protein
VIPNSITKLAWNLPWLLRYPFWRANEMFRRSGSNGGGQTHVIFTVANHFEPGYNEFPNENGGLGVELDWQTQMRRLDHWCDQARAIGEAVRDHDGTPFRHTNFYPIEQYNYRLLERMAEMQDAGFGEVEIHLHHGVESPDNAANLRRTLIKYRDILAEEHQCLSREHENDIPRYAFVHGNWTLGNSANGWCCGVDSELEILAETGCYIDMTLPSMPSRAQVSRINAIYECGHPLNERMAHRSGPSLRVGSEPQLPVILCGPLVFDWENRRRGLPLPKIDNGALTANYPMNVGRFERWRNARIGVIGRPDWVFVKVYCHGFFDHDQPAVIGDDMRAFFEEVLEFAEASGQFKVHFASAREAFNMVMAAVDGHEGNPNLYRDYKLRQIMRMHALNPPGMEVEETSSFRL